jgi:membrane-associated phospholipid phosphatase
MLAAAIGISRVYVGAHWPSDVIAGALLGVIAAWFTLGGRGPRRAPPASAAPAAGG